MCREVRLGVAAQWWFERWMRINILPSLVLERLEFEDGVFATWLPQDTPDEEAQTFETGGKFHWSQDGCWPHNHMVDVIKEQLQKKSECVWVFEDPLAHPSDPWLLRTEIKNISRSTDRVYYVLDNHASEDSISKTARGCLGAQPPMLGVCSVGVAPILGREMTVEALRRLAQRIDALVIGAYDGEGFVAWRRSGEC